ncbi:MAG: enoyl-CoA hydratase [Polaromonas sp. 39-63-25]|nr:MAG: enoyl-CoA hydratase [Polaromonas sp. 35-63-35]OYZ13500.1 MAG: enoyl-CoA hydratase [Polaromonas sp. 16-63-31]OYZ75410.1 MAG: enoyl-CoA hydratase [Polaromonas sp. 24-63-21]OZA45598.1 MAG: enoyl-CoA hydratase [Polaromonas sp. 17-63-33]OZA85041.1 MAG: enoyl-CoA hydratase [Polaromonas sp. 39-63-25]
MSNVVQLTRVGPHVAVVTLNRPEACNAIDGEMARELERMADEVEQDASLWVAVLMGAGDRAFCAGADLKAVASGHVAELSTARGGFAGFVRLPRRKLWIAAVHGAVLAGGLELLLACDFAVASSGSRFGLPEVKRGLVASEGGLFRLPRALPRGLALRMVATGASIDSEVALEHGLITEIVAPDMLRRYAVALASEICQNAPLAVRESLAIARDALTQTDAQLETRCRDVLHRLASTADFREGSLAFVERRAPQWIGA